MYKDRLKCKLILLSYHPCSNVFEGKSFLHFTLLFYVNILFRSLAGRTLFISGASRGIGKSIALRAAKDGANVIIAAKSATAHPKLPGTIYTAAEEGSISITIL